MGSYGSFQECQIGYPIDIWCMRTCCQHVKCEGENLRLLYIRTSSCNDNVQYRNYTKYTLLGLMAFHKCAVISDMNHNRYISCSHTAVFGVNHCFVVCGNPCLYGPHLPAKKFTTIVTKFSQRYQKIAPKLGHAIHRTGHAFGVNTSVSEITNSDCFVDVTFGQMTLHCVPDIKVHGVPPGSCRPRVGPMLAPWTLLSGVQYSQCFDRCIDEHNLETIGKIKLGWVNPYISVFAV